MMKNQQNKDCEAKLEILRQEIDNIDSSLIDMLERRMKVVERVGELKQNYQEKFFIRSSREADMIKDLAKKAVLMPKSSVISIWRKIITASNMSEQPLKIAICNNANSDICRGLIREYYNENVPVSSFEDSDKAILALKNGEVNIAIFSIEEDFWIDLARNIEGTKLDNLKIFAKIPFYDFGCDVQDSKKALSFYAIAAKNAERSKEDNSFLYLESKANLPIDEILQIFKLNNLDAKLIKFRNINSKNVNLFEISGFYTENSIEIQNIRNSFGESEIKILGNYATPILI